MSAHESPVGETVEWYTPESVFAELGIYFDLDPCAPRDDRDAPSRYWTRKQYRLPWHDGLALPWRGLVFVNPPYGREIANWTAKAAAAAQGGADVIALVPSRPGSEWGQRALASADLAVFRRGRVRFLRPDGNPGPSPAFDNLYLAWGSDAARLLKVSGVPGVRVTAAGRQVAPARARPSSLADVPPSASRLPKGTP